MGVSRIGDAYPYPCHEVELPTIVRSEALSFGTRGKWERAGARPSEVPLVPKLQLGNALGAKLCFAGGGVCGVGSNRSRN